MCSIALASCASAPNYGSYPDTAVDDIESRAVSRIGYRTDDSSLATGALVAGTLVGWKEQKRVPTRKTHALFALASHRVLGAAIDMSVLEEAGYSAWRTDRSGSLYDSMATAIGFTARRPEGGFETQSGMLYLPLPRSAEEIRPLTWIIFLKGTELDRDKVPSRSRCNETRLMEAAAALGYAVWAPDYAGMGDAAGMQDYCVPESMASSALDGLAAARRYALDRSDGYAESGRLVILGYSQGGLGTMAALKAVAEKSILIPGLSLVSVYPLAAPLDLTIGKMRDSDEPASVGRPDFQLLLAIGWARAYPESVKIEDILLPNIIETVVPLFEGSRDSDELCTLVAKAVGRKTGDVLDVDLYSSAYLEALKNDPDSASFMKLRRSFRLDRQSAPAGVRIVIAASPHDEAVDFFNSQSAYDWMRASDPGSDVTLVKLASSNHSRAALEGLLYAIIDMDRSERMGYPIPTR